jgi:hypothetical protein
LMPNSKRSRNAESLCHAQLSQASSPKTAHSIPRRPQIMASDLEAYVIKHATDLQKAAEKCKAKGLTAEVLE